jgi:formylmethanofuran dehydrogenase subunit E
VTEIIRFVGRSGSGKTTLLCEVVRLLAAHGLRVAVFKHAHHRVDLDRRGKDSFRFAEAGAASVTVVSPEKVAVFEAISSREPELGDLTTRVPADIDLVLTEGFHEGATPYFLILGPDREPDSRNLDGRLLGVIGRAGRVPSSDVFDRADPAAVARCILDHLSGNRQGDAVSDELDVALKEAGAFHGHLCPGQVLGVRMALLGCASVGVEQPRSSKKLIAWVETDRCGADAVQTVTGCKLGKRTLKFVDNGKLAATFLNTETGQAVRILARADSRDRAAAMHPALERREAQKRAYRTMPEADLFIVQPVSVTLGEFDQPGMPVLRVTCTACAEEVNDHRHVEGDDGPLCRSCAGGAYYTRLEEADIATEAPW